MTPKKIIVFCMLLLTVLCAKSFSQDNWSVTYQAEDGDFYGVKEDSSLAGFSGTSYIRYISYDESYAAFEIDVSSDGLYTLVLRTLVKPGKAVTQVRIENDDGVLAAQRLGVNGVFTDVPVHHLIPLKAGKTSLYICGASGEWMLDSFTLRKPTKEDIAAVKPSSSLVTKNPLSAAQKVYEYLLSMQGKGILTGQQIYSGLNEIKAIFEFTGKYPAVLGIDFIDYSPSRIQFGARGFTVNDALKYWAAGGIVAAAWHWNAPTGLINEGPDKQWFSGFYANAVTFNLKNALSDKNGTEYKLLLRDIDAIARLLKKLQDAGVPVLWRPLHEAAGGWFWWGASGAEPYLELYKLMFDRLTHFHKLTNLIWVWNGQDAEWYPGDEYVDMISWDIYPPKRTYLDHTDYLAKLQACSFAPKLTAISENGALPDIDAIAEKALPWSYYCTWDGEFVMTDSGKISDEFTEGAQLKKTYEHPFAVTRDELPSFTQ